MTLVVDVPLNTAIADLDEALRTLLRRELKRHGFEGVEVAFDAPSKEWSGKLTSPTVDLFLYDLREASDARPDRADRAARERPGGRHAAVAAARADLRGDRVDEGGRGRAPAALAGAGDPVLLPAAARRAARQRARRRHGARAAPRRRSAGRARRRPTSGRRSAGQYKASIDFVVHTQVASGAAFVRGPEVRTQTIRTRMSDGPARTLTELHRIAGTVRDADGQPVADAWVAMPEAGLWTATRRDGRFRFDRIQPGQPPRRSRARPPATRREATLEVPGGAVDLVIGGKPRASRAPRAVDRMCTQRCPIVPFAASARSGEGWHMESAPVLRVLLGDLAPIMAIGLRSVLEEEGIEVIGQETRAQPDRAARPAAAARRRGAGPRPRRRRRRWPRRSGRSPRGRR